MPSRSQAFTSNAMLTVRLGDNDPIRATDSAYVRTYIDEICCSAACGNSFWNNVAAGYISGTTLTLVGSIIAGSIATGNYVAGAGVTAGTTISSGTGPYAVSQSQTLGSAAAPVLLLFSASASAPSGSRST